MIHVCVGSKNKYDIIQENWLFMREKFCTVALIKYKVLTNIILNIAGIWTIEQLTNQLRYPL